MPQLNLAPWFAILVITWVTIALVMMKLKKLSMLTMPHHMEKLTCPQTPWPW